VAGLFELDGGGILEFRRFSRFYFGLWYVGGYGFLYFFRVRPFDLYKVAYALRLGGDDLETQSWGAPQQFVFRFPDSVHAVDYGEQLLGGLGCFVYPRRGRDLEP
jgi:hypothetical protein